MAVYEETVKEIEQKIETFKELERDHERQKDNDELRRQRKYDQEFNLEEAKQTMKEEWKKRRKEPKKSQRRRTGTSMQYYQSWSLRNFKELTWIGRDFGISSRQKSTRQK